MKARRTKWDPGWGEPPRERPPEWWMRLEREVDVAYRRWKRRMWLERGVRVDERTLVEWRIPDC